MLDAMQTVLGLDIETVAGTRTQDAGLDESIAAISIDRSPTRPMIFHPLQLSIDLENPEGVAEFLEAVAKSIREKRRIVFIVE